MSEDELDKKVEELIPIVEAFKDDMSDDLKEKILYLIQILGIALNLQDDEDDG